MRKREINSISCRKLYALLPPTHTYPRHELPVRYFLHCFDFCPFSLSHSTLQSPSLLSYLFQVSREFAGGLCLYKQIQVAFGGTAFADFKLLFLLLSYRGLRFIKVASFTTGKDTSVQFFQDTKLLIILLMCSTKQKLDEVKCLIKLRWIQFIF